MKQNTLLNRISAFQFLIVKPYNSYIVKFFFKPSEKKKKAKKYEPLYDRGPHMAFVFCHIHRG